MEWLNRQACFKTVLVVFVCMTFLVLHKTKFQKRISWSVNFANPKQRPRQQLLDSKINEKPTNSITLINWEDATAFDDRTCRSDRRITSCIHSKVKLIHINAISRISRTIEVEITLYDGYNNTKNTGGDVILMWAESIPPGGSSPGHVTDHMNGTYSGNVQVHWTGQTKIFVKLASAIENACLRFKAMKKYGDSVYAVKTPYDIHYRFVHLSSVEYTRCSALSFVYGYESLCNFTSLNGGFSWFCGKPKKKGLDCSKFNGFQMKPYNISELVPNQPRDEVIQENGHCVFQDFLQVEIGSDNSDISFDKSVNVQKCSERPKKNSWLEQKPSGYSMNKTWIFNNCRSTLTYDSNSLSKCLGGKNIHFIGDSTLRQYLVTVADVMNLKIQSPDGFSKSVQSVKHNIHISWRKHEMPFHNMEMYNQNGVQSSAYQISKLASNPSISGNSTFVIIHYGSHLQEFPPDVYRSRLVAIKRALKHLLEKKPGVKIFVKGAAPIIDDKKWFDVRISLIFNDPMTVKA